VAGNRRGINDLDRSADIAGAGAIAGDDGGGESRRRLGAQLGLHLGLVRDAGDGRDDIFKGLRGAGEVDGIAGDGEIIVLAVDQGGAAGVIVLVQNHLIGQAVIRAELDRLGHDGIRLVVEGFIVDLGDIVGLVESGDAFPLALGITGGSRRLIDIVAFKGVASRIQIVAGGLVPGQHDLLIALENRHYRLGRGIADDKVVVIGELGDLVVVLHDRDRIEIVVAQAGDQTGHHFHGLALDKLEGTGGDDHTMVSRGRLVETQPARPGDRIAGVDELGGQAGEGIDELGAVPDKALNIVIGLEAAVGALQVGIRVGGVAVDVLDEGGHRQDLLVREDAAGQISGVAGGVGQRALEKVAADGRDGAAVFLIVGIAVVDKTEAQVGIASDIVIGGIAKIGIKKEGHIGRIEIGEALVDELEAHESAISERTGLGVAPDGLTDLHADGLGHPDLGMEGGVGIVVDAEEHLVAKDLGGSTLCDGRSRHGFTLVELVDDVFGFGRIIGCTAVEDAARLHVGGIVGSAGAQLSGVLGDAEEPEAGREDGIVAGALGVDQARIFGHRIAGEEAVIDEPAVDPVDIEGFGMSGIHALAQPRRPFFSLGPEGIEGQGEKDGQRQEESQALFYHIEILPIIVIFG